jgi:hypothetical protein
LKWDIIIPLMLKEYSRIEHDYINSNNTTYPTLFIVYKIGQKVKVNNSFSTFPEDNRGTVVGIVIKYIVRLDGGLTGLFDSNKVKKDVN